MSYKDIYKRRLNRYGNDYQSRTQGEREKMFDLYLYKSIYRVEFKFDDEWQVGSFERYKQDETETLHYLLTKTNLIMPQGTILRLPDQEGKLRHWMVYYLEKIKTSGYNRYIMIRMTHFLKWTARDGSRQTSWAYMYGQQNNMLKDELKSRSRMDAVYDENLKSSFFIMPVNPYIRKDDYFIVGEKPLQEYFRVTGYDIQSTQGVEYVTIDPVYEYDLSPAPEFDEDDPTQDEKDYFWFNGGINNG